MQVHAFPLVRLRPHPRNSNVMPEAYLAKLAQHLEHTDRYPPVIVRPFDGDYQILDGHHRVQALQRLGRAEARCVVWDVDDAEALLLLATLNRLQGQDDPRKRAALVGELNEKIDLKALADKLPEDRDRLRKLLRMNEPMPTPRAPQPIGEMPVAVHFFVLPKHRQAIERRLRQAMQDGHGQSREEALLSLLGVAGPIPVTSSDTFTTDV